MYFEFPKKKAKQVPYVTTVSYMMFLVYDNLSLLSNLLYLYNTRHWSSSLSTMQSMLGMLHLKKATLSLKKKKFPTVFDHTLSKKLKLKKKSFYLKILIEIASYFLNLFINEKYIHSK